MRAGEEGGGCFPTGKHYPGIAHLLRVIVQGLADEFEAITKMTDVRFVSIDTETTGTDPAVDRIVEFGAVVWHGGEVVARHSWLMNPGRDIPKEASDIHGIKDEDVRDKPGFAAVADEILAVLEGNIPLAYNADFDRMFFHEELARAGVRREKLSAARQGVDWVDPLTWARELQKEEKSKALGEVAERLGVKLDQAHRAIADAEAAVHVLGIFLGDGRVPPTYASFMQEQRRLGRIHDEERAHWRRG